MAVTVLLSVSVFVATASTPAVNVSVPLTATPAANVTVLAPAPPLLSIVKLLTVAGRPLPTPWFAEPL